jgi:uncharacterized repeat protein (TIGR02543 family)
LVTGTLEIHIAYSVTFDADGGKIWEEDTLVIPAKESSLALKFLEGGWTYSAEKTGYVFLGWYVSTDGTETVIEEITVTSNIILKAKWEAGWTVTFNLNGGTYGGYGPYVITVAKGSTITPTDECTPFYPGFSFEGWYTDDELTEEADEEITVTEDIELYAKWESLGNTDDYVGVWKDADGNVYILEESYGSYSFVYLSADLSDYASDWSWSTSSINDKDASLDDGTLTIDGVEFTKVTEKKTPKGSDTLIGEWQIGDLIFDLDEDGGAFCYTEDWSFMKGFLYTDDGTDFYLLAHAGYDENWDYADGEVLLIIPIVDGAPQGWTLVEDDR